MSRSSESRANQSIDQYLKEISEVPLLTPKEEVELARRIKLGDQQAMERLTEANLRFVVSVAKLYQNKGFSLGDLINEGNLGLIKAATRFDETRGFKFISYAVWWIRQGILQALADNTRVVRLPLNRVGAIHKVIKAYSALEQTIEREPTASEIAQQLDMTHIEVADTMRISGRHLSVDATFNNTEDNRLLDVIENTHQPPPDSQLLNESLKFEIERVLTTLTKREAEVIRMYYGLGYDHPQTLEDIGERFNLTRERIRQIKEKALLRLRHFSRSKSLRTYLG
jgi:RNA polymerase primary sigma factor